MLHWLWLPKLDRKIHQRFPESVFQQWISWVVTMYFLIFEIWDESRDSTNFKITTFYTKCWLSSESKIQWKKAHFECKMMSLETFWEKLSVESRHVAHLKSQKFKVHGDHPRNPGIHQRFPELVFQQWISWVVSMYFLILEIWDEWRDSTDDFSQKVSKDIAFNSKCSFFHGNFDSELITCSWHQKTNSPIHEFKELHISRKAF